MDRLSEPRFLQGQECGPKQVWHAMEERLQEVTVHEGPTCQLPEEHGRKAEAPADQRARPGHARGTQDQQARGKAQVARKGRAQED